MINIKLVSLKSDKTDLCKYIKSDSQLLIFKITLDYLFNVSALLPPGNKCSVLPPSCKYSGIPLLLS